MPIRVLLFFGFDVVLRRADQAHVAETLVHEQVVLVAAEHVAHVLSRIITLTICHVLAIFLGGVAHTDAYSGSAFLRL